MGRGGIACPKPLPNALTTGRRRAQARADLEKAYAEVDRRDGPQSRVTGRWTVPFDPDRRVRREHDHIRPRSTHPELIAEPDNIFVCTAEEHQLIHAGALEVEGTNARRALFFHWNRTIVAPGKEPFVLLAKRS